MTYLCNNRDKTYFKLINLIILNLISVELIFQFGFKHYFQPNFEARY